MGFACGSTALYSVRGGLAIDMMLGPVSAGLIALLWSLIRSFIEKAAYRRMSLLHEPQSEAPRYVYRWLPRLLFVKIIVRGWASRLSCLCGPLHMRSFDVGA